MRVIYTTPTDRINQEGEFVGLLFDEERGDWMAVIRTEIPFRVVQIHPSNVLLGRLVGSQGALVSLLDFGDLDDNGHLFDLMCQRLIANGFKV